MMRAVLCGTLGYATATVVSMASGNWLLWRPDRLIRLPVPEPPRTPAGLCETGTMTGLPSRSRLMTFYFSFQ